jgi:hypothetical protein
MDAQVSGRKCEHYPQSLLFLYMIDDCNSMFYKKTNNNELISFSSEVLAVAVSLVKTQKHNFSLPYSFFQ